MRDDYNDFWCDKRSCHTEWIPWNGPEYNMALECLVNHYLFGKIFLKLSNFSPLISASIPYSAFNGTGKPFSRWIFLKSYTMNYYTRA